MAIMVLKDASVVINTVDLSNHIKQVNITYDADIQETTAMGDNAKTKLAGLLNWTASLELYQDYASSSVDATLFPLVGAAAFAVVIKPASGAVSASNPSFTGNAVLGSYSPLGGSVGDVNMVSPTLEGSGLLVRAVS